MLMNAFEICRKISMMEITIKEATVFSVATFFKEHFDKYIFLEIYEILIITNSTNLDCDFK